MSKPLALIVDDEPDIRELLEITLARMDIDARSADSLESAAEAPADIEPLVGEALEAALDSGRPRTVGVARDVTVLLHYTTAGLDELIGLGVSSISQVSGVLWQNSKELPAYYAAINSGQLPVERGFSLNSDDKLRAALISQLICHFELDVEAFSERWQLSGFWQYFAEALERLQPFMEDGLVEVYAERIKVTDAGRLWVRSICACFDAYLTQGQQRYSKVV
mgnify:CR=1 FL=1